MDTNAVPTVWLRRGNSTPVALSIPQLKAMHAGGWLAATDTIRMEGASTWTPLAQVKGFFAVSARAIYETVRKEMDGVLRALEQPSKNAELASAIRTASDNFRQLKDETDVALHELDKNAEWDAYTIALYGETNAGKSTIIETLRILMGEKTKLVQQEEFRQTLAQTGIDANAVETWTQKKQEIAAYDEQLKDAALRFADTQRGRKVIEDEVASRIQLLVVAITSQPWWRRLLSFIWKIPAKAVLLATRAELDAAVAATRQVADLHEQERMAIAGKIEAARKAMAHIDAAMQELAMREDGSIIGDGRSDFTRDSTRYEFEVNGNKLVLLDVPGIEGDEALVTEPIMQAVRKAHAVFYVTRKADPPQKGDEKTGRKGTLEKIKEHLGAQTEVWTIFNKGIRSAEQLRMPKLVNDGELKGLAVLEEEMRRQLGAHYRGLFCLSAYAAFLGSTDNLVPGGAKSKDRLKFLAAVGVGDIQARTGFRDFISKLGSEMVENSRMKIRKSNFNKANEAVLQLKRKVDVLNKEQFIPLFEKLEAEARASSVQLDSAAAAFKNRLESDGVALIDKMRNQARKKIYERIDRDIKNDEFKSSLESAIKENGQQLEQELPKILLKISNEFQEEVRGIVEQFQEHVQGFLDDATKIGSPDLALKIDIDNGIKVAGLAGVLIGAGLLWFWWNPVGWVLGAIAVVELLLQFAKSVIGFFSTEYKKSQQRKSADENLDRVFVSIRSTYTGQLEANAKKFEEKMESIKLNFGLPAAQAEQIKNSLAHSGKRLSQVSRWIAEGGSL